MKKIQNFKTILVALGFVLILPFAIAPVTGQTDTVNLTLSFTNLADPGDDHYEGWLIVDGSPVSSGKFSINSAGDIVDLDGTEISTFTVENIDADKVSKFVLTLESSGDTDSTPAAIKPLAGDFTDNKADLSINLGVSLGTLAGTYILATPSDGADTNENSGIWFLDPSGPSAGLSLPDLSGTDWVYEGWVVIDGTPVTTGKFNSSTEFDSFDGYSGDQGYPEFPGEDFLQNAPSGLSFPTDIAGAKAVISIEPRIDNSPDPFQFKPLAGDIPANAVDHTAYTMTDMSDNLASGSAEFSKATSAPFGGVGEAFLVLIGIAIILRFNSKRK